MTEVKIKLQCILDSSHRPVERSVILLSKLDPENLWETEIPDKNKSTNTVQSVLHPALKLGLGTGIKTSAGELLLTTLRINGISWDGWQRNIS